MTRERVQRWTVGIAGTLALVGVGLLVASTALVTAALVPLAYVLFGAVSRAPDGTALSARREFDPANPALGAHVTVTLTLENEGRETLGDVRLADGVPDALAVVDGSPRAAGSLAPGDTLRVQYTVVARHGEHAFDAPAVRLRSLAADEQVTTAIAADGETELTATTRAQTPRPVSNRDATEVGGGTEFHATREYRRGDPMGRIDWRHVAKTGEFVTVQYRGEQTGRVVVVVDARPVGRVAAAPGHPTGATLCAERAEQCHAALARAGVDTGVAAVGLDGTDSRGRDGQPLSGLVGPDGVGWVGLDARRDRASALFELVYGVAGDGGEPETRDDERVTGERRDERVTGERHDERVAGETASESGEATIETTDSTGATAGLLRRLPPETQILLCTPLVDDWPVTFGREATGRGHSLVVLSPDVLGETPGQRLGRIDRQRRLDALDRIGTRVSYRPEEHADRALRRALSQL